MDGATPLSSDAQLIVRLESENTEVYIMQSGEDNFIAMSGALDDRDEVIWLAQSAAAFHGIPFSIMED